MLFTKCLVNKNLLQNAMFDIKDLYSELCGWQGLILFKYGIGESYWISLHIDKSYRLIHITCPVFIDVFPPVLHNVTLVFYPLIHLIHTEISQRALIYNWAFLEPSETLSMWETCVKIHCFSQCPSFSFLVIWRLERGGEYQLIVSDKVGNKCTSMKNSLLNYDLAVK